LDSTCLVVRELDEIFHEDDNSIDFNDQMDTLVKSSIALRSLIHSTKFRRMKKEQQKKQVDNIINTTELATRLRGSTLLAEAEYAYINIFDKNINLLPMNIRGLVIGGVCLGMESIEGLRLRRKAIRNNADLIDGDAGICLVLDPNEETKQGLNMGDQHALYLPIGGQNLEIKKITD